MNFIKILGASGGKSKTTAPTSFQIYKDIIIDAGNVLRVIGDDALYINHVFLTHAHSDHVVDLPFIIEDFFEQRKTPLIVYALPQTIETLKKHIFNNDIWPDFSKIPLLNRNEMSLIYYPLTLNESVSIRDYTFRAIKANHIAGSCGYLITKNKESFVISGDTYINHELINILNKNSTIKSLIIECSFPNNLEELAAQSLHFTPKLLGKELQKLNRDDLQIFIYHIKPYYKQLMVEQINALNILKHGGKILECGDVIHFTTGEVEACMLAENKFERLIEINLTLSNELNKNKLFDMLLSLTRELTHADAGTLYILSSNKKMLDFEVVQNDTLDIHFQNFKNQITWESLPLYLDNGKPNLQMVAAMSALESRIVNIKDVYQDTLYNFEGTKLFDANTGYQSQSMLVVPLINHENDVIGVLQLINKSLHANVIEGFNKNDERIVKALAGQVAMALNNSQLIQSVDGFINAFIETICHAIEAKSTHTKNHILKVKKIAIMLAQAIHKDTKKYKEVVYSENDLKQIEVAAMMHDIGKVSMPDTIIDKSTKLETIIDRIELINERFEILYRDLKIQKLEHIITKTQYHEKITQLQSDQLFIEEANVGGEFMSDDKIERLYAIAKYTYMKNAKEVPFLSTNEIRNLSIKRGTLTNKEKDIMNSHAKISHAMLEKLPFPKKYKDVVHIACNHHEKLNGKGYPLGLKESQLTLEDKIMALADIFEALTSSDRPYKNGKKLSEVFKILSFMVKDGELDKDLVEFLHKNDILQQYAKEELQYTQIDESRLLF